MRDRLSPDAVLAGEEGLSAVLAEIKAADITDIEPWRIALLGRKGVLTLALRALGTLAPEKRQQEGQRLNAIKRAIEEVLATRQQEGQQQKRAKALAQSSEDAAKADMSLPLPPHPALGGALHPISQLLDEALEIFAALGFSPAYGPELETEHYNFTALNIPPWHPARDMHDTFYMQTNKAKQSEPLLLRTHTSPVQIHAMEAQNPPVRIIAPGRVYRRDSDRTHTPMFHQIEGLVIEKTVHIGHLLGCLRQFLGLCFGTGSALLRVRPSYFPFTEPSIEVDAGFVREGKKLRLAVEEDRHAQKQVEWLEMGGAGMVHPNVLRHMGVDSEAWQGFAFGMGLDRLASLKYGLPDLRRFFDGDVRWVQQHGRPVLWFPSLAAGLGR